MRERRILIADSDPCLVKGLFLTLTQAGYLVETVADGNEVSPRVSKGDVDLLLLGAALPNRSALTICQELRMAGRQLPVIMLCSRITTDDRLHVLELGADDCLVKPFYSREILARINAVLRRHSTIADPKLCFPHFSIDVRRRQVNRRNQTVCLTAKEYELLLFLANNPGLVFSREQLLRRVWEYNFVGDSRTVDVHIHRLRDKLEPDSTRPVYLLTARGHGYYFDKTAVSSFR